MKHRYSFASPNIALCEFNQAIKDNEHEDLNKIHVETKRTNRSSCLRVQIWISQILPLTIPKQKGRTTDSCPTSSQAKKPN